MRLFVRLVPPPEVLDALPALPRGVRPVAAGQHHLTLCFLGEVADPEPVSAALEAAGLPRPAPLLRLSGAGAFGAAVWLGLDGDLPALRGLADDVRSAARAAGVALERRRWEPHLTVGRGALPEQLRAYDGPEAPWTRVDLVRSDPVEGRARHRALRSWELLV